MTASSCLSPAPVWASKACLAALTPNIFYVAASMRCKTESQLILRRWYLPLGPLWRLVPHLLVSKPWSGTPRTLWVVLRFLPSTHYCMLTVISDLNLLVLLFAEFFLSFFQVAQLAQEPFKLLLNIFSHLSLHHWNLFNLKLTIL